MRIAFVLDAFPMLSTTFILNQITGLIERGNTVDIFAEYTPSEPAQHPQVGAYQLLRRTHYANLHASPVLRAVATLRLAARFQRHRQILFRSLDARKYGTPALTGWLTHHAASWLEQPGYDIVHCHFGPNGVKGALLRAIGAARGKLVTAFHGNDLAAFSPTAGKKYFQRLVTTGDLFMPISARWTRELIELGCDPAKISVHPMGVDCKRFAFSWRDARTDRPIRILSLARLIEKKGIAYGIRAVAQLIQRGYAVSWRIVGGGPLKPELEQLTDHMGLGNVVTFVGWLDQTQVREELAEADILLVPSVTARPAQRRGLRQFAFDMVRGQRAWIEGAHETVEGVPVSIMEGMASGLPVVSTQHGGIPDLVQDGVTGYLAPERDADALADRLGRLIAQPELRAAMGRAGRAFVEKHHDIDVLNDRLVEIYRALIQS